MGIEVVTTRLADRHGVHYEARDLRGRTDRPLDMGGQNQGLMASEHVLVALASCTTTTALKIAEKRRVRLDDVRCEASMSFDERGEVDGIGLKVTAVSPDEDKDVLKVFDLAERSCTVSKLLAFEVDRIVVVLRPEA